MGDRASTARSASESSYQLSLTLILALLAAAVAIAVTVAIVLARSTRRAVREVGAAAKAISIGDIDQRVVVRSRDELGEMARDFESMIDYLRSTVAIAESIAQGDLNVEVRPRSERDALGNSLVAMTASLRGLVADNDRLLAASREEAHTDALTGLANRRASCATLEATSGANEERPARARAVRPRRVQALQRHLRAPGRRCASCKSSATARARAPPGPGAPTESAATSSACSPRPRGTAARRSRAWLPTP